MPTVIENINIAAEKLSTAGLENARREASSLLSIATGRDRTYLITNPAEALSVESQQKFDSFVQRRANREPLQHIRGTQEFFGLDFIVNSDVLIPRPETEMIVEIILEKFRDSRETRFAEIGVGSGCISVSILANLPEAAAVASDISPAALKIAAENAVANKVADRLSLIRSDILESFPATRFNAIVANLPYIPACDIDGLEPEVRDHDPLIALTDGGDGLSLITRLIDSAPNYLKHNGLLVMEFGIGQADHIVDLLTEAAFSEITTYRDLNSITRVVSAEILK